MFLVRQTSHTFSYNTEDVIYVVSNTKYNIVICTKTLELSCRHIKK